MEFRAHDETISQPLGDQQRGIVLQLIRASATMHHIDEVFLWATQQLVLQYGMQVAQFWAMQVNQQGDLFPELRSFACRDNSLPQHLVVNRHIAALAERILQSLSSSALQSVDTIFSPNITLPMRQYGLNYCAGIFLSGNVLLPPASTDFSSERLPTPLKITLLLFFQQIPHQHILSEASSLVQQILSIAKVRGLLPSAPTNVSSSPMPPAPAPLQQVAPQQARPGMLELIPHRIEDPASNPLAASVGIANEYARRFYAAINGRRNVGELCRLAQLDEKEIAAIVRMLLAQQRIQLYEPTGRLIESSRIFHSN